jgi:hypothetical protein
MGAMTKLGAALGVLGVVALIGNNHPSNATAETGSVPSAVGGIPKRYLAAYKDGATACSGLDWALLAGIGKVETNHGRSNLPGVHSGTNSAGAAGPMQFLYPTFETVRARHSDVGDDIYDPEDAARAAGHYLCDSGLRNGNTYSAIWTYNHAGWYVAQVRTAASRYRAAA